MVRSVAGNLPEQVKNNQYVNLAAGNGGQKMSQYSWFTVYCYDGIILCLFPIIIQKYFEPPTRTALFIIIFVFTSTTQDCSF